MSPREARRRTEFHLEQVGLSEYADRKVEEYSRGMKQRLHIARGLLTDPTVLFMDEPTMGLDPIGAQELRRLIPQLVEDGRTVLLTTHYMFEADQLCRTIAMINHGRLVTLGTPTEIKRGFRGNRVIEVEIRAMRPGLVEDLSALEGVERVDTDFESGLPRLMVQIDAGQGSDSRIVQVIGEDNIESPRLTRPHPGGGLPQHSWIGCRDTVRSAALTVSDPMPVNLKMVGDGGNLWALPVTAGASTTRRRP